MPRSSLGRRQRAAPLWRLWADMRKITICCLAAALLMIGLGLWRGEADMVLHKGVNLCLECVGIG